MNKEGSGGGTGILLGIVSEIIEVDGVTALIDFHIVPNYTRLILS